MKKLITITTFAFSLFFIQSCKKDKTPDTPAAKQCRLIAATVTPTSGTAVTYSFSYNNDKSVSQIISSESPVVTQTFTYSGHTINLIEKTGNTITSKRVMTTNNSGRLLHSESRDLNVDTITSTNDYEYNNNGDLLKITSKYGTSAPEITNAVFTNGNISSIGGSGSVTTFDYYTDQNFRIGDYIYLTQFLNSGNAFYIFNKNLVKTFTSGSSISNFNYTFDSDNNISQTKIVSGSDITTVDVQQVCE